MLILVMLILMLMLKAILLKFETHYVIFSSCSAFHMGLVVFQDSQWLFTRKVVDFSRYRMYTCTCNFINGYTNYNLTATCSFSSNIVQINITCDDVVTLLFVKFLVCNEIDTFFITRVSGKRWYGNLSEPLYFDNNDMIDDVESDIINSLKVMFQDVCKHVEFYKDVSFNLYKKNLASFFCNALSTLPFRGSISLHIASFMRPDWFDYQHDDPVHDIHPFDDHDD